MVLEWAARFGALVIVALLLIASLRSDGPGTVVTEGALARETLARWTAAGTAERLHLRVATAPDPVERAWSSAFSRTGATVTWSGDGLTPLALSGEALADPRGGVRVLALAPGREKLALSDEAGLIDSVALQDGGASVILAGGVGIIAAAGAADRAARIAQPESAAPRTILVLGAAGWESRFIITALEERGWRVAARLGVAPGISVTQGEPATPDTARHSAVVVVDSSVAAESPAIARFARRGGGVVLVGSAAAIPALRVLAPASTGARVAPAPGVPPESAPRSALGARPLLRLTSDAVPLEHRGAQVMAAARRAGAGRVVQLAYDDSWRWRMGAGEGAVEAHREWWSRVVSGVARVPLVVEAAGLAGDTLDAAPYTRLVAALGAPREAPTRTVMRAGISPWWALLALLLLLLGEWSSRRLRGAQ